MSEYQKVCAATALLTRHMHIYMAFVRSRCGGNMLTYNDTQLRSRGSVFHKTNTQQNTHLDTRRRGLHCPPARLSPGGSRYRYSE